MPPGLKAPATAVAVLFFTLGLYALPLCSQPAAGELDRRIERVIHETRYTWRMPHDAARPEPGKGVLGRFVDSGLKMAERAVRTLFRWIGDLLEQLSPFSRGNPRGALGFDRSSVFTLLVLSAIVIAAGIFFVRTPRSRTRSAPVVQATAVAAAPDLSQDDIAADQLPADTWTGIARELLEQREFRLAMRAFHLSALAHLAQLNLIAVTRYKTNRDYEAELARRGHAMPGTLAVFRENLSMFEGIWYGSHAADMETVSYFAGNVDRIRSAA